MVDNIITPLCNSFFCFFVFAELSNQAGFDRINIFAGHAETVHGG